MIESLRFKAPFLGKERIWQEADRDYGGKPLDRRKLANVHGLFDNVVGWFLRSAEILYEFRAPNRPGETQRRRERQQNKLRQGCPLPTPTDRPVQ